MDTRTLRSRVALPIVLLLLSSAAASAQQRLLTLDDIYDPVRKIAFDGHPPTGLSWIDATHYAWPRATPGSPAIVDWLKVDAATGDALPLFDAAKMEAALAKQPGVTIDDARRLSHARDLEFNAGDTAALVTIGDDLYAYTFGADTASRLTYTAGEERTPSFSPDGRLVAFVRDNNLFVVDLGDRTREPADDRRLGDDPRRPARLGVRRGNLRPRPDARVLVEPRLVAHRVPAPRRHAGARLRHDRPHPVRPDRRALGLPEGRRSESGGDARRRARERRRAGVDRHVEVLRRRSPHRQRVVDAGRAPPRLRRAEPDRRHGSTSTSPISTPARRARCCARRARRGSTARTTIQSG